MDKAINGRPIEVPHTLSDETILINYSTYFRDGTLATETTTSRPPQRRRPVAGDPGGEGGAPELVMAQFEKIPQGLKPKDFISRIFGTTQVVPCYKTIQTEPVSPNFIPSGEML